LGNASIGVDDDANRELYGRKVDAMKIVGGETPIQATAKPLIELLDEAWPAFRGYAFPPGAHGPTPRYHPTPPASLPPFPWPPPVASARIIIPQSAFKTDKTFGNLSITLDKALDETGYFERSYFSSPNGIAIVTRMERINDDGSPEGGPQRWDLKQPDRPRLSLPQYIRALFMAEPGYYRLIAFVVTDEAFGASNEPVSTATADSWLNTGLIKIPLGIQNKPLPPGYSCIALIYEFQLDAGKEKAPEQLVPSHLDPKTHLVKSGLWAALHLQ
jgi:hypothetical protein